MACRPHDYPPSPRVLVISKCKQGFTLRFKEAPYHPPRIEPFTSCHTMFEYLRRCVKHLYTLPPSAALVRSVSVLLGLGLLPAAAFALTASVTAVIPAQGIYPGEIVASILSG